MGAIRLLAAPIRTLFGFPLVQLAVVIVAVLLLQAADEHSLFGQMFIGLDRLVDATVRSLAAAFNLKPFTRSWLTTGFWIGYVYLACLLILALVRMAIGLALDIAGRWNLLWSRNAIARERGIAAYRAWEPFERIRPDDISQARWEETYAWPADNQPPYRPLVQRMLLGLLGYLAVFLAIAALLQAFTPFPVLTWLGALAAR
jgi:hypothetical protein